MTLKTTGQKLGKLIMKTNRLEKLVQKHLIQMSKLNREQTKVIISQFEGMLEDLR